MNNNNKEIKNIIFMRSILVTGGCGFIGSHTSLLLIKKGYKVYLFDSNINSLDDVNKNILAALESEGINAENKLIFIKGDLREKITIENIFLKACKNKDNIESVIHFAGLKAVRESIEFPLKYWEHNVLSTINLLKVMDKFNCRNIIFSSSATIYVPNGKKRLDENTNIGPINTYGNTKATIEKILNDLFKSSPKNWRIANLRYFNPLGAHPSGLLGEDPKGMPNNIFPIISLVALGEIKVLSIFGDDWNTHDGTCIRDYIHVMDVAEGHIASLEFLFRNKSQIINLNLGTGKGCSVLKLVETFEKVNGVKIPYKFAPRRIGDHEFVVSDNYKAKKLLNWEPKKSIEEMCKDGWKWSSKKRYNKNY